MSLTRIFRRRADLLGTGLNQETAVVENPLLAAKAGPKKIDAERLFVERYAIIQRALEAHRELGVLIFAFDEGESAVGHVWLRASLDKTRATVVGRHSMCGLVMPRDRTEISLRHMVFLVRASSHSEVRVRAIDLHTKTAFGDEDGRVLQAVMAEGPMFLSVGGVHLVVVPTEGELPVPTTGEEAYACLPERVFFDERHGTSGHIERRADAPLQGIPEGATLVRSKQGPLAAAGELCKDDETPRASLTVRADAGPVRRAVGDTALERGVLFGRYQRCDVGTTIDEESRLSRVHLMLIRDGDDVVAVDTSSTNGTYLEGRSVAVLRLEDGHVLDLAGELEVAWHAA